MPIDGVSFQNSGFNIVNPTEVNVQAESLAKQEAEKKIKEPDKSDKTEADSDETERDLQGRDTQGDDDEEYSGGKLADFEKNKKFKVKFNPSTEMIELLDSTTGEIIETLAPEDLLKLLSKSKAFSGVFVDRKI